MIRVDEDDDADGVLDRSSRRLYGPDRLLLKIENDEKSDGSIDWVTSFVYNERQQLIREEFDRDADGVADTLITYEYDENGNRVRRLSDNDGDGDVDGIDRYTFDDSGKLVRDDRDRDNDGLIDRSLVYKWRGGLLLRMEYWSFGTVLRLYWLYHYGPAAVLSRIEVYEVYSDGSEELWATDTYYYDQSGREVRHDSHIYGHLEHQVLTSYDRAGRMSTQRMFDVVGGRSIVYYTNDCP